LVKDEGGIEVLPDFTEEQFYRIYDEKKMKEDDLEQASTCFSILKELIAKFVKLKKLAPPLLKPFGSIANTFCVQGSFDIDIVLFF
jgi:hypothetical protein